MSAKLTFTIWARSLPTLSRFTTFTQTASVNLLTKEEMTTWLSQWKLSGEISLSSFRSIFRMSKTLLTSIKVSYHLCRAWFKTIRTQTKMHVIQRQWCFLQPYSRRRGSIFRLSFLRFLSDFANQLWRWFPVISFSTQSLESHSSNWSKTSSTTAPKACLSYRAKCSRQLSIQ